MGAPRARVKPRISPDHQQLSDAVSKAMGVSVQVKASGRDGYTFTLKGHDAVRAFAARLGVDIPDT